VTVQPPGEPRDEYSHQMIVDLVRALRHQLRTPINHIVGFSEMLQEEAADRGWDVLLPDLERIRLVGRDLTNFVSNTIDIAKVEGGRLNAEQISRDLRTPLESIIGYSQLLQEEAEERGWNEALPDLQKVEHAAKYLTGLIDAVLDLTNVYSKASAGDRAPANRPAAPSAPRVELPRKAAGSILLTDDNEFDAEMLSRRLTQFGYDVQVATNGRMAFELLAERPFDLHLLDVLMPELDGLDTLRTIKSTGSYKDTPVIMISAIEEIPIVVRCIELGADDYLTKPVDPVLLAAKVSASLEKKRLREREREYLRQVAKLTVAAGAVEAGTFEPGGLDDVAARGDPLGRLARVFERMARELHAREEALQRQVRELRIEIDEVQKARDVAEITEAEYFQRLLARATEIRSRREQPADS